MSSAPPCRPFISDTMTVQSFEGSGAYSFMWDMNMLCVAYPDGSCDEWIDVQRTAAYSILMSKDPLAAFNRIQRKLRNPVIMRGNFFPDSALQTEDGDYLCS